MRQGIIASIILIVIVTIAMFAQEPNLSPGMKRYDADGNKIVNIDDVITLLLHLRHSQGIDINQELPKIYIGKKWITEEHLLETLKIATQNVQADIKRYESKEEKIAFAPSQLTTCADAFVRGDSDNSVFTNPQDPINLIDVITSLDYLYGTAPVGIVNCDDIIDYDDNENLDLLDVLKLLQYFFLTGGNPPASPYPAPGHDEYAYGTAPNYNDVACDGIDNDNDGLIDEGEICNTPIFGNTYYVTVTGAGAHDGTIGNEFTFGEAVVEAQAGDTIIIDGGTYTIPLNGYSLHHSGTAQNPITFTNKPGQQAIFDVSNDREILRCYYDRNYPDDGDPTNDVPNRPANFNFKSDYVKFIGTDVAPQTLPNGVVSQKGIVALGANVDSGGRAFTLENCDHWEIAGIDFVWIGFAYWDWNTNIEFPDREKTEYTYLHDNRVWNFHDETGFQVNGDHALIENNELYLTDTTQGSVYGCQFILLQGNGNVVRNNYFENVVGDQTSPTGGPARDCVAVLHEFDLADENLVYNNEMVWTTGIQYGDGDNNLAYNNIIIAPPISGLLAWHGGIEMRSFGPTYTGWPCDDPFVNTIYVAPGDDPNDPTAPHGAHPDYQYYFQPRNCEAWGNQIYNNIIIGYPKGISIYDTLGIDTVVRNNIFINSLYEDFCVNSNDPPFNSLCDTPPAGGYQGVDTNFDETMLNLNTDFVNYWAGDYRPTPNSPLVDSGFDLTGIVNFDHDGNPRPNGLGYDIGPYEY